MTAALMAVAATAAATYFWAFHAGRARLALFAKPLPVLCLAIWVALANRAAGAPQAWWIVAGLAVSMVADVLIERSFLAGLATFLLAHVAYIVAFLTVSAEPHLVRLPPFALWGVVVLALLWPGLGGMRVPVTVYATLICIMMWRAAATIGSEGAPQPQEWSALVGAVLFAASDTLIALDRFHRPLRGARYPIMLLYWAGQLLIALSAR